MRHLDIRSYVKAKKRMKTGRTAYLVPNLMARNFKVKVLNKKWVTDVTEFRVGNEKLYLSPMMDLANREIIAYQIGRRQRFGLVSKMLKEALSKRGSGAAPLIHSDQDSKHGRKGNCDDNAVIERFFSIVKSECFYPNRFANVVELEEVLHEYIRYYNEVRIKPALNNLSPMQYRAQYLTS
ncbi:transposase InsO family protein [Avibacterium gallinarum]|uniref:Integrase core domain n=2 Tax=Avibacterium gallinarum TaxID=755 RepID=A0A379AWT5_AVIGA|nr:transposase InsO family protein [Avibacterium gallinarum]SUB26673.1 Integrase core domain [Avibacterium gallinarum]